MLLLAFKLDERTKKVALVLCALFIILLLILGVIYLVIDRYMKKEAKKMDIYMYDLLRYKIVKTPAKFKSCVAYHERRSLFVHSRLPWFILILLTAAAVLVGALAFSGQIKEMFTEFYKIFPKISWPTVKQVNAELAEMGSDMRISGPGWMPASTFPTFDWSAFVGKEATASSEAIIGASKTGIFYASAVYWIATYVFFFMLVGAILGFIARINRSNKVAHQVFVKDLEKVDLASAVIDEE